MWSVWIICGVFISTLCATVKPSSDLSIEDTIVSLKLRVNTMEERFSSMESTETLVRKVKEELVELVQNSEVRCLAEKDDLTKKIEGIESSLRSNQKDVSEKLQAIERTVREQEEEMRGRLVDVQMTYNNEFQDVSENLQNLKNELVKTDNHLLMELQQVQKQSLEAVEKVGTVKEEIASALDRERTKTVILQVKLNETRGILNTFLTSQQNFEDGIRRNMTSTAGTLEFHVNESLKSGFESMLSNLTAERRRMENSFLKLESECANSSYVTQLGESVQNLNLTMNARIRSIHSELHPRATRLEEENDQRDDVEEIKTVLKNHTLEISAINKQLFDIQNPCEDEPPFLMNGKSTYFKEKLGSKVQYECDRNFVMTRNSSVRCVSGKWEGEQPVCSYFDPTFFAVSKPGHSFDCYSSENSKNIEFYRMLDNGEVGSLPQETSRRTSGEMNGIGFQNVSWYDSYGVYKCEFNTEGRTMDIAVLFQTDIRLFFLDPFQVANRGDTVHLQLSRSYKHSIRWEHNGAVVSSWENKTRVEIQNVQPSHAGIYRCDDWQPVDWYSGVAITKLIVRKCEANLYGEYCDQKCPPCYNGGICHDHLGICVCPPGFVGHNCERACPQGRIGTNCSMKCTTPNCEGLFLCKQDPYGCSCARGFIGADCHMSCRFGWFGASCKQPCHCKNFSSKCNKYTGACSDGCKEGWTGESCQIKVPE